MPSFDSSPCIISQLRLENMKAGRKGNLKVATEVMAPNIHNCVRKTWESLFPHLCQVFQVAPSLHMVEVRKAKGDTLEFHKVCYCFLYSSHFLWCQDLLQYVITLHDDVKSGKQCWSDSFHLSDNILDTELEYALTFIFLAISWPGSPLSCSSIRISLAPLMTLCGRLRKTDKKWSKASSIPRVSQKWIYIFVLSCLPWLAVESFSALKWVWHLLLVWMAL